MIDNKLLNAYVAELEALRTHGRELAEGFPDIAARLDIGPRRSRDPHVERVVESTAFLAARLRMLLEQQAAEVPTALLQMLAPTLLEPVPSMAVAELQGGSEVQSVPRGTRFDHQFGGHALVCFASTMDVTVAPFTITARRLGPQANYPDAIALQLNGTPPEALDLYLGHDALTATILQDALTDDLGLIEIVSPGGGSSAFLPKDALRLRGLAPDEGALPIRAATHHAHRVLTEFMVFPEKFRFATLEGAELFAGTEVRFLFSRPVNLPRDLPPDIISANRVPLVNLWATAATPFEITGTQLEYPVRVDAQRYRLVECHSVEEVDLYGPDAAQPIRLDPLLATGDIRDTAIRWGTRRSETQAGGEVMLYFQGLDYRELGQRNYLAAPRVLASNGDLPQRARVADRLTPVDGMGDWRAALATVPTVYRAPLLQSRSSRVLISHMQSSLVQLATSDRRGSLRHYLRQFPGGDEASWIDALGHVAVRPFAIQKQGIPQAATRVYVGYDPLRVRTTSTAVVRRVLGELFDSQRGLNRVEEVFFIAT